MASMVKYGRRRDNRKGNIPPSASMTPAAMRTVPPETMTKATSTMPMHDTGKTQQYLKNETNAFTKFTFVIPRRNNVVKCIYLSHFHRTARAPSRMTYCALPLIAP